MAGYQCSVVDAADKCQVQRLHCFICKLLLCDPVQNITTGERFCRSCIQMKDNVIWDEYRSDKAIQKEIMTVQVRCHIRNNNCSWQGTLQSYVEDHSNICERNHYLLQENIKLKEENSKLNSELQELQNPSFERQIIECHETDHLALSQTPLAATFKLKIKPGYTERQQSESVAQVTMDTQPITTFNSANAMTTPIDDEFDKEFEQIQDSAQALEKKVTHFKDEIQSVDKDIKHYTRESDQLFKEIINSNHSSANYKFKTYNSIHQENVTRPVNEFQMQCVLQLHELLRDTRGESFIFTPTWYAPSGHQFQALICLNGYDVCLETHVSAFVMSVSGTHDDNILWPVTGLMTIDLLNPDKSSQQIVRRFRLNCSFNKPLSLEPDSDNIVTAIGCLDLIPKENLFDMRYVKNGTMRWGFEFKHK